MNRGWGKNDQGEVPVEWVSKDSLGRDIEAGIVKIAVQAEGTVGVLHGKEPGAP